MRYSVRAPSCVLFSCLSLLFPSLLLLGVLSHAYGSESKQVNLKVSSSYIDFGILEEGPAAVKEVLLENSSDTEIIIKNVKAS